MGLPGQSRTEAPVEAEARLSCCGRHGPSDLVAVPLPAPGGPGSGRPGPTPPHRSSAEHVTCSLSGSFLALGFLLHFSLPASQTVELKASFHISLFQLPGLIKLITRYPHLGLSSFYSLQQLHPFMANRWGNSGSSERLYFFGLQNHCR